MMWFVVRSRRRRPHRHISTRVRRLDALISIAETLSQCVLHVGTHPHQADEEDGIPADELIALTKHPKIVWAGRGGARLLLSEGIAEEQERGFRHAYRCGVGDRPAPRHPYARR